MPRVEIFYAYKCHPEEEILKVCLANKTGFDVASVHEMQICIDARVDPKFLILANPIKSEEMIHFAKKHGISKMTFDCADELRKIKKFYP